MLRPRVPSPTQSPANRPAPQWEPVPLSEGVPLDWQRSVTSWWSSSAVWSSSLSPGCSCCRTCRTSSAARPSSSWSTLEAWTSWPSATQPRSAAPENISTWSEYWSCVCCLCRLTLFLHCWDHWGSNRYVFFACMLRKGVWKTERETERERNSEINNFNQDKAKKLWPQTPVSFPSRSYSLFTFFFLCLLIFHLYLCFASWNCKAALKSFIWALCVGAFSQASSDETLPRCTDEPSDARRVWDESCLTV